jgi:hypothetical protein
MTQAADPTPIDPNNPITRDLLRSLAATVRAQMDETEAEYADRFAAVTTAWASYRPRDPQEQMLAAQIVGAHYAALDCLTQVAETQDPAQAERHRRSHAALTRTMQNMIRLLADQQRLPAIAMPPMPAIAFIPQPRRRAPEPKPTQQPIHREKALAVVAPRKDPSKMTDEELEAGLNETRTLCATALFDRNHPLHDEAVRMQPEILPGLVVPNAWYDNLGAKAG